MQVCIRYDCIYASFALCIHLKTHNIELNAKQYKALVRTKMLFVVHHIDISLQ